MPIVESPKSFSASYGAVSVGTGSATKVLSLNKNRIGFICSIKGSQLGKVYWGFNSSVTTSSNGGVINPGGNFGMVGDGAYVGDLWFIAEGASVTVFYSDFSKS